MRLTFAMAVSLFVGALIPAGCAAPLLATAAPIGVAAAKAGSSAFTHGELRVARYATMDETWQAVQLALERLQLTVHTERIDERSRYLMAMDEKYWPEMKIRLDRRSPVMTKISIRVGLLGDPAVSNHLLRHIDDFLRMSAPED